MSAQVVPTLTNSYFHININWPKFGAKNSSVIHHADKLMLIAKRKRLHLFS
ncbi:hypothetical protein FC95_GL001293 [Lentilactobacillus kefiri DSM 20587 = JCM 5818]|uniref:Uncharacterized protein n=1 Tax=Lentilactobacillus kefiri DSM 20587 = JCM 5818 TaxID=1423764 RepID=A0A8E1RJQ8_LENKE|nr:hypothetical protein FD08_GL000549 [Lentilactobacillus parakefiri DSM 10551]KRM52396.1 hypothetical protein FC95_GL001293 [Lentilactobacillus kefiri DSM 20587 = JCM 5818]